MGGKSPKAPDPYAVSAAQTKSNIETAREQARLGMTGQDTPWGQIDYEIDPSSPSGYRAVQKLTPEEQELLSQSQTLQWLYGDTASNQLNRVGQTMATPFDMSAARAREISDIQRTLMDPQWSAREDALRTRLMNSGIREGDEQWVNQFNDFGSARDDAYNRMFLSAYDQANRAALTERNIPMMDLASLGIGAFPGQDQNISFQNTPSPTVANTNVAQNVWNAYQADAQRASDSKGGLGSFLGTMGGWATRGFPGMATLLSDRRIKTNIERIGTDPRGWGVYRYNYLFDGVKKIGERLGFMADEVEKVRPDAVVKHPHTNLKMVDYGALAMT